MSRAKSGGGITSNKFVQPGIRTGSPNRGTSPAAADQIGQATAFKKEEIDAGRALPSVLGNEAALRVGKGAPGADRTIHKSGSQNQWGPPNQGESPRSEPRGFDVRGRLKGDI